MSERLVCAECGADVTEVVGKRTLSLIDGWQSRQMISSEQAERLRSDIRQSVAEPGSRSSARWPAVALTPSMALLLIGGILVVSAVVMVATELWDDLTPFSRFAVLAVPAAGFYACAAYFRSRQLTSAWVATGLALIGACMAPFVVWLALSMTLPMDAVHAGEASWVSAAAAAGLVIQILTLAWLRSAALTGPPSVTLVWLAGAVAEWTSSRGHFGEPIPLTMVITGALLMVVGQEFRRRGFMNHAKAPDFVGVAVAMLGLTILASEQKSLYDPLSLAVPIGLIGAACRPRFRPYLWAGALFLVINTFRVGLSYFGATVGLPIGVLMAGLVAIIIGYVVHRVRKEYVA